MYSELINSNTNVYVEKRTRSLIKMSSAADGLCCVGTLYFSRYQWLLFSGITVPLLAGDRQTRFLYGTRSRRRFANAFFSVLSCMSCFGVAVDFSELEHACSIAPAVSFQLDPLFGNGWLNPRFSERSLAYRWFGDSFTFEPRACKVCAASFRFRFLVCSRFFFSSFCLVVKLSWYLFLLHVCLFYLFHYLYFDNNANISSSIWIYILHIDIVSCQRQIMCVCERKIIKALPWPS